MIADHHIGTPRGVFCMVIRERESAGALGIGDGRIGPVPPALDSEAAMLPVVEELGGDEAVLQRVGWYSGALAAA